MLDLKETWKDRVASVINDLLKESGSSERVVPGGIVAELPPKPEMGDLGFPMFGYAKTLRRGPPQIAAAVAERLAPELRADGKPPPPDSGASVTAEGPYVNIRHDRGETSARILGRILDESRPVGRPGLDGRPGSSKQTGSGEIPNLRGIGGARIMVEFSSPNTNKPLHLGHLRNNILGESVSRILSARGAEVRRVCIINDRGIHICKSMLAYKEHGAGKTPESEGIKSDHFVGDWYVEFNRQLKNEAEILARDRGLKKEEAEAAAPCMARAQELLRSWEAGDAETTALWKKMNGWTIDGIKATYERTGISFDHYYFESETYLKGREEILKGLENGIFYRAPDGAVMVDLEEEKLDKKVLLRGDGTSIYITQDIGLAIYRNRDWPFDRLIYVVGSEQQYHFKALFAILKKLGFPRADNLYHLSYGMVNLPEGKMKSREGTVVDADDLLDELRDMALEEIREKDREEAVGDAGETAEKIALGALHYFLLSVSPSKDMQFNPRESLSFTGNTGPYLQYMGARISSMLRKAEADGTLAGTGGADAGGPAEFADAARTLTGGPEWELLKILAGYDEAVAFAAENIDPSVVAAYLYDLSRAFSRFYHDCPILQAESRELVAARLALSKAVLRVLKDALELINIPFLETM
ncbi:MAG: arginine--tRNA ligase [Treponema sp.]|jgi:arginyl-tRNA synthetase|nr:arginine--tRNA ligase [Treponema sp.]